MWVFLKILVFLILPMMFFKFVHLFSKIDSFNSEMENQKQEIEKIKKKQDEILNELKNKNKFITKE